MHRKDSSELSVVALVRPLLAGLALMGQALAEPTPEDAAVTAWSSPFCVDTRSGAARAVKDSAQLALDPVFAGSSGASAILKQIVRPDTPYAVTSVVETVTAAGSATVTKGDYPYVRYLHETRDASGSVVGTLAADLAFTVADAAVSSVCLDARTNSLAEAVAAGGAWPFAYDSTWCTNGAAARVEIARTTDRFRRGTLVTRETRGLFAADAPCAGDVSVPLEVGLGGRFTYSLTFRDAAGQVLGEPLSATCHFKERWGVLFIVR